MVLIVASCSRSAPAEIQGVLVDVQSQEITNADAITLRDDAGTLHTFRVSPAVAAHPEHPSTAAHLRQEMMGAARLIVRYQETGEGRLAIEVFHAPGGP